MMNNLSFICNNVKGILAISKQIKIFEYLKNFVSLQMVSFFFKKHTSMLQMKSYGWVNLKGSYFSVMVEPTHVMLPLVLLLQIGFKYFEHKTC